MKQSDLMPGHKLMICGRNPDLGRDPDLGDILLEHGPKIGERWWLIVGVERCRTRDHYACQKIEPTDRVAAWTEAQDAGGEIYHLRKERR